jgi:hypothetical protein
MAPGARSGVLFAIAFIAQKRALKLLLGFF